MIHYVRGNHNKIMIFLLETIKVRRKWNAIFKLLKEKKIIKKNYLSKQRA